MNTRLLPLIALSIALVAPVRSVSPRQGHKDIYEWECESSEALPTTTDTYAAPSPDYGQDYGQPSDEPTTDDSTTDVSPNLGETASASESEEGYAEPSGTDEPILSGELPMKASGFLGLLVAFCIV
jgi:hypothetical protein